MDVYEESLKLHRELSGKIEIVSRMAVDSQGSLRLLYTPGVAAPCLAIKDDPEMSWSLTRKNNLVAVITDGSAVLGLGDIGPDAGMPVMEGKCILFKEFGNVDAFPICVDSKDVDTFVDTVCRISKNFGGINLEDIAAPRCFEIEKKLKERLDIPVFHDDQHGTAVIVLAGIINALKLTGKKKEGCRVVINGAGSAGCAICHLLLSYGFTDITLCDKSGIITEGDLNLNFAQAELSRVTNKRKMHGDLSDALCGADIFVGVSAPRLVTADMVRSMAPSPIIFAMSNPEPEIMPDEALAAGAAVAGTGRSDFPNQINNIMAFPGIFRGALDVRASEINEEMKKAAAFAIAETLPDGDIRADKIVPSPFDPAVFKNVSEAVKKAAIKTGVARIK